MQGLFGDLLKTKVKIRQCPITGGMPTRMREESFRKLCELHQAKARGEGRGINDLGGDSYCKVCQGSIVPEEVEFVEVQKSPGRGGQKKEVSC